jgi:hypothetical protein
LQRPSRKGFGPFGRSGARERRLLKFADLIINLMDVDKQIALTEPLGNPTVMPGELVDESR